MAILFFADRIAEEFFYSGRVGKKARWSSIRAVVRRKLDMLHYAADLQDLRMPPGNRLESLRGELEGFFSIRVNDQFGVVFRWTGNGPGEVRVVDYH